MKKLLSCLAAVCLLSLVSESFVLAASKEKSFPEKAPPHGSIRVKGKTNALERVALAKISFQDAMSAALVAVPGKVISGELDVDEGNLEYDFEIIDSEKKVMDVSIDAGNAKVLDVDEGDLD
jgi:uncharacterized membrane protein YkoI